MIKGIQGGTNYQNTGRYTSHAQHTAFGEKEKSKDKENVAAYYTPSSQTIMKQDSVILTLHTQTPQETESKEPQKPTEEEGFMQRFSQFVAKYAAMIGIPVQEEKPLQSWFQNIKERVRVQFESIRNSLSKFLKQEQTLQMDAKDKEHSEEKEKEKEHKLSAFSGSGVEVQPGVVVDNHLLASYNKRGSYTTLGKE